MAAEAAPKGSGFGDVPPAPFFISSRSQDSPHETSLAIPPQARPTYLQLTGHLCGAEEAEQAEPTAPGSPCCCPCLVSSPSAQTFSWETTAPLSSSAISYLVLGKPENHLNTWLILSTHSSPAEAKRVWKTSILCPCRAQGWAPWEHSAGTHPWPERDPTRGQQ